MASEVKVRSPAPRLPDSPREHVTPRFQPCPGVPLSHRRVSRAHTIFPEGKSLPASYVSTRRALLLSCLAATTAGLIALPRFAASSLTLEADSVILGYPLLSAARCGSTTPRG